MPPSMLPSFHHTYLVLGNMAQHGFGFASIKWEVIEDTLSVGLLELSMWFVSMQS